MNNVKASACRRFGRFCNVRQMMITLHRTMTARRIKPTHEPEELNHSASSVGNSLSLFFASLSINALIEWLIVVLGEEAKRVSAAVIRLDNCKKTCKPKQERHLNSKCNRL